MHRLGPLLLLALSACATDAAAALTEPLGAPVQSAQRVFGREWTRLQGDGAARTLQRLADGEASRLQRLTTWPAAAGGQEAARLEALPHATATLLAAEAGHLQGIDLGWLRAEFDGERLHRGIAAGIAAGVAFCRLDRRPLGEPDDPEHRTGPGPAPAPHSLGYRLLRRLWF